MVSPNRSPLELRAISTAMRAVEIAHEATGGRTLSWAAMPPKERQALSAQALSHICLQQAYEETQEP